MNRSECDCYDVHGNLNLTEDTCGCQCHTGSMTITQLVERSTTIAAEKGWIDSRTFGDHIALMHSELSEALEEFRNGHGLDEIYFNGEKPEGIPIELADVLIRIAMLCGQCAINLEAAIKLKERYNASRAYRHGGKKI